MKRRRASVFEGIKQWMITKVEEDIFFLLVVPPLFFNIRVLFSLFFFSSQFTPGWRTFLFFFMFRDSWANFHQACSKFTNFVFPSLLVSAYCSRSFWLSSCSCNPFSNFDFVSGSISRSSPFTPVLSTPVCPIHPLPLLDTLYRLSVPKSYSKHRSFHSPLCCGFVNVPCFAWKKFIRWFQIYRHTNFPFTTYAGCFPFCYLHTRVIVHFYHLNRICELVRFFNPYRPLPSFWLRFLYGVITRNFGFTDIYL